MCRVGRGGQAEYALNSCQFGVEVLCHSGLAKEELYIGVMPLGEPRRLGTQLGDMVRRGLLWQLAPGERL